MKDKVLQCPTVQEVIEIATNMYGQGWDERNGGNISVILTDEEVSKYVPKKGTGRKIELKIDAKRLAGKYVLVTGTGKYFKNVKKAPEVNLGIIRICDCGMHGEIVWGFVDGGNPTSEFPTHLLNHMVRREVCPTNRVVMHCHPVNTMALTFVLPEDEDEITRVLWRMQTESIVVFPEGVGYLPWMVCGGKEIGDATAEKAKDYRVVLWGMHGIFGMGSSIDEAFGLIETVEKAAMIYMLVKDNIRQQIRDDQLKEVAAAFNLDYKKII